MDLSFGARLRLQREQQQVSLADIAAKTKVNLSLLQGLERDDVSFWPSGIFRRAHLRAYAEAIGLEPDGVVRDFLALYPDSVEVLPAGAVVWPDPQSESSSPQSSIGFRRLVTSAMTAVPTFLQRAQRSDAAARPDPPLSDTVRSEATVANASDSRPDVAAVGIDAPGKGERDFLAVAQLCTRLGQSRDIREVRPVLREAAGILDAVGLIVWSWDTRASALRPVLTHGYSDAVLARLPSVPMDDENAVAAAFRSAETCIVNGGDRRTGALVAPLMAPGSCVGVLALEFSHGEEQREWVRAFAMMMAAQLVTLFGHIQLADAVSA